MWSVPRMWEGRTVAVLASGESMSQAVADGVKKAGIHAIVINSTFRLAPWANMLYAADTQWWGHPENVDAHEFGGLKVSCQYVHGVLQLRHTGHSGFDDDAGAVRTGGNSGYQAVHIAVHAGASKVLLFGLDMGGGHWHGEHPAVLERTIPETYERWIGRFGGLAKILEARGVDVVNCSPVSRLKCFRRSTLEKEVAACAEPAAA